MTFAMLTNNIVGFTDAFIIPLLYALAFLFFVAGVARYFFSESEEARRTGREFVLWGLIGLAVIFAVWGLVRLFLSIIGF